MAQNEQPTPPQVPKTTIAAIVALVTALLTAIFGAGKVSQIFERLEAIESLVKAILDQSQ